MNEVENNFKDILKTFRWSVFGSDERMDRSKICFCCSKDTSTSQNLPLKISLFLAHNSSLTHSLVCTHTHTHTHSLKYARTSTNACVHTQACILETEALKYPEHSWNLFWSPQQLLEAKNTNLIIISGNSNNNNNKVIINHLERGKKNATTNYPYHQIDLKASTPGLIISRNIKVQIKIHT